jgi:cation diffusion facilitator family transporter
MGLRSGAGVADPRPGRYIHGPMPNRRALTRYAWLSIAAAVVTIALKGVAFVLTGSVGLLSDAIESFVNLAGASVALTMLTIAARPPDDEHHYGHDKAEYFASGVEGTLILGAAIGIAAAATIRLLHPRPVEQAGIGLLVSTLASVINFGVARVLLRVGKRYDSITLEADARHLFTDVWTSVGVIVGIGAVVLTGWTVLDPIVALAVAGNIVYTGLRLLQRSVLGLLDSALPAAESAALDRILAPYGVQGVRFHAIRTRKAAARRFVTMHVLVPGEWTVQRGHTLLEQVEREVRDALPNAIVFTHLEPVEDPVSFDDVGLDR